MREAVEADDISDDAARLAASWEPPPEAGRPVGLIATTYTFDAEFLDEELLARFLGIESDPNDGLPYVIERDEKFGATPVVVLVDRRHADRADTLAWDVLSIPLGRGRRMHAKVAVLAWERCIRILVTSANLTRAGYRENVEVFANLDLRPGGEVPRSVLDSTLQFLEELVTAVPSLAIELEGRTQGPVARALALITDVRRQATRLRVRKFWGPLALQATPVFLRASGRGPSVLDQMSAIWRGSPKPDWLEIVSPFWSEPDSTGHDPVVSAHLDHFIRGARERTVHVFVPGKADGRGRWLVSAPGSIRKSVSDAGRATLRVSAIPDLVDGDRRPLHAKVVKWTSVTNGGARQSLALIGSSNATLGGLGLGRAPRNVEAGVVYRWTGGRSTFDVLEALLPSHAEEVENARFRVDPLGVDDEEDGRVPLPGFFQWAILAVEGDGTPDQRRATVDLGLGGDDEPGSWSATLEGTVHKFDSEAHRAEGRPAFIRWSLKSDEVVLVRCVRILWRTSDGAMGDAFLPVNAMDRSKCAGDEAWRALTLDALLDALAKGTPLHRAWRRKRRAGGRGAAGGSAPQLDPHRRVDTSQFLLPRMRRISGALEGLENRLAAPVSSSEALAYRLSGPLGPISLGRMLVQSVEDPAERTFLVAELRLVVASARDRVRSLGPSLSGVRRAFDSSIAAVSALDPAVGPPPAFLARYLESVRKRTRSRGSR